MLLGMLPTTAVISACNFPAFKGMFLPDHKVTSVMFSVIPNSINSTVTTPSLFNDTSLLSM
jgi:hypothetical protein